MSIDVVQFENAQPGCEQFPLEHSLTSHTASAHARTRNVVFENGEIGAAMFVVEVPDAEPLTTFGNPAQEAHVDPVFFEYSTYTVFVVQLALPPATAQLNFNLRAV